jgi:hypothetical protein
MKMINKELFEQFILTCPYCGAGPTEAHLEIISGSFKASKMYLERDGFSFADCKELHTYQEKVFCNACFSIFYLEEILAK